MASPPDPVTKQSRGFTFVRFVNPADAERALKEMQKDVNKARRMRLESCVFAVLFTPYLFSTADKEWIHNQGGTEPVCSGDGAHCPTEGGDDREKKRR